MPRSPLLPILRAAGFVLLGAVLLCRPKRAPLLRPATLPVGGVVDVRADAEPAPPGGRMVPNKPFPGQVVPDERGRCTDPDDVVLSGGCWAKMAKQPHPVTGCGERYYQNGDACYSPVMKPPRTPTSLGE